MIVNKNIYNYLGDYTIQSFEKYIFIYSFYIHSFPLLVSNFVTGLFYQENFQLKVLLIEKYSLAFLAIYLLVTMTYNIFIKKERINKCQIMLTSFFLFIVFTTMLVNGKKLAFDYFTKISLFHLAMEIIFMFNIASHLSDSQFKSLLKICGFSLLTILFLLNISSLIIYWFSLFGFSVDVFGMNVVFPVIEYRPGILNQTCRYSGFYWNSGIVGILCSPAVALGLVLGDISKYKISKMFLILSGLSNIAMVFLSNSRTGLIVLGVLFCFSLSYYLKKYLYSTKKVICVIFFVLFSLIGVICIAKYASVHSFITTLASNPYNTLKTVMTGRMELFEKVIEMIKNNPWIGCGWNKKIQPDWNGGRIAFDSAHNLFISVLLWGGLIGLGLFLVFLSFAIYEIIHSKKINNPWLVGFVICCLTFSMTEQGLLGASRDTIGYLFWLILGYLCTGCKCEHVSG